MSCEFHSVSPKKTWFEKKQARPGAFFSGRKGFHEGIDGYLSGQETTARYLERITIEKLEKDWK